MRDKKEITVVRGGHDGHLSCQAEAPCPSSVPLPWIINPSILWNLIQSSPLIIPVGAWRVPSSWNVTWFLHGPSNSMGSSWNVPSGTETMPPDSDWHASCQESNNDCIKTNTSYPNFRNICL